MRPRLELIDSRPLQPSAPRRRILLLGEHRALLRASAAVLRNLDADVVYRHPSEFEADSSGKFDLVVLCHTLTGQRASGIAAEARRRWSQTRILHISRFELRVVPAPAHADAVASCGNVLDLYSTAFELLGDTAGDAELADQERRSAGLRSSDAVHPKLQRRWTGND
jgi:hypothetical protein